MHGCILWTHLPVSVHREASSTRAVGVHVSMRVGNVVAMNAIHPERMAEIGRWSPTGAPPVKKEWCHASWRDARNPNLAPLSGCELHGQRTLNSFDTKDLHQEVIIPAAELAFHGEAFFARVLLQE